MNKYKTFSRRFWAAVLDMGVFVPLGWLDHAIWSHVKEPNVLSVWLIINSSAGWLYSILLQGRYGQTIGKFICNVRVLDKTEKPLSMKQAIYRDALPIVIILPVLFYQVTNILNGQISSKGLPSPMNVTLKTYLSIYPIWFSLELLTMLTNKKRRALHDFIAGSVVIIEKTDDDPMAKTKYRYKMWALAILIILLLIDRA